MAYAHAHNYTESSGKFPKYTPDIIGSLAFWEGTLVEVYSLVKRNDEEQVAIRLPGSKTHFAFVRIKSLYVAKRVGTYYPPSDSDDGSGEELTTAGRLCLLEKQFSKFCEETSEAIVDLRRALVNLKDAQ